MSPDVRVGQTSLVVSLCLGFALVAHPARAEAFSVASCDADHERLCAGVASVRGLLNAGSPHEALGILERVVDDAPSVQLWLETLRIEALLKAQRLDEAATRARRIVQSTDEPWLTTRALQLEADALRQQGDSARHLDALRALWKRPYDDEANTLAQIIKELQTRQQQPESEPFLRRLLLQYPAHDDAIALERRLDDGSIRLGPGDWRSRIDALIQAARFERAEEEARHASSLPSLRDTERDGFLGQRITALVRGGKIAAALALLSHRDGRPSDDEWQRLTAWTLGKAGQFVAAADAWVRLMASTQSPELAAEACFFAGFSSYEAGAPADAETQWQHCAQRYPQSALASAGVWYRALLALLAEDYAKAEGLLADLVKQAPRHKERDKHEYWLAKSQMRQTDPAKRETGRRSLVRLASQGQATYYGLLARAQTELPPLVGVRVAEPALAILARESETTRTAKLLRALGFHASARALAARQGRKIHHLALSQSVGDAHRAWKYGARLLPFPQIQQGKLRSAPGWRASYATPFRETVYDAVQRYPIDPAFVYAIMRTESGFQEDAVSRAGARGLLQLMPYTATGIAAHIGQPPPSVDALFDPAVNIPLGVAFLALAHQEFGHPALAAAVYNGGPDQVARWLARFGHLEPDLFVERIPFRETRDYVKRVSEAAAIYRALEGHPLALNLPTQAFGPGPARFTWFPSTPDAEASVAGAIPPTTTLPQGIKSPTPSPQR